MGVLALNYSEMADQTDTGQETSKSKMHTSHQSKAGVPEQQPDAQWKVRADPSLSEAGWCWVDRGSAIGAAIRVDVRAAVGKVWIAACRRTRTAMGDPADTAALMEVAAVRTSQYLDRLHQEEAVERAGAVLMKIFSRLLRRHAERMARLQPAGQDIEFTVSVPSWEDGVNAGIFLEQLEHHMSRAGVTILTLRRNGHSWQEIAQMLQATVSTVKKRFWREIEGAKVSLGIRPKKAPEDRTKAPRRGKGPAI